MIEIFRPENSKKEHFEEEAVTEKKRKRDRVKESKRDSE